jgi:enoyl-CoA hydratase/carnithine racemase
MLSGLPVTEEVAMPDETPVPPHGDWLGTPCVRLTRHGLVAHCVVDRPEAKNAMTASMSFAVRYAIDRVNGDATLTGLILTGTDEVFIPGGDLGRVAGDDWGGPGLLGMDTVPFDAIRYSPKPVVSAINGIAQGGGLLMAIMSDVAVASERATFRAPEL